MLTFTGNSFVANKGGALGFNDGLISATCNTIAWNGSPSGGSGLAPSGYFSPPLPGSIIDNTILGNGPFDLVAGPNHGTPLSVAGNWWGTPSELAVEGYIRDFSDLSSLATVVSAPPLTGPAPCAPPLPPAGVSLSVDSGVATLTWKPNSEPTVSGYRVYWGTSTGPLYANVLDVGTATSASIPLEGTDPVYFAVTAYQSSGYESWFSNEATTTGASEVSLSTTTLAFPEQTMGTTSAAQNVTVTNTGTHPISFTSIKPTGEASADFQVISNCPDILAVGQSCAIDVAFRPLSPGARLASLAITNSATDSPQSVSLSGSAVEDSRPPAAHPTQDPVANEHGWNKTDVTVSWNWTDTGGSGIDPANCTMTSTSGGEGSITLSASCSDLAGNSTTASYGVQVDKTQSLAWITSPLDLSTNPVAIVLTFGASDSLSGLAAINAVLSNCMPGDGISVQSGDVVTSAGVYCLTVTATDLAGNLTSTSVSFVVYDPNAGSVIGAGQFTSATGALISNSGFTGKAHFIFQSAYAKGGTVPTGNTRFWLQMNAFTFASEAYEWLVVNQGGTRAQFKGTGRLDGQLAPNGQLYRFMIWATDGGGNGAQGDTFRIKIWYEDSGDEVVMYDNGIEQAVEAGSGITVKTK